MTAAPKSAEPSALRAIGFRFVFSYWTLFILTYGFAFLSWLPPIGWARSGVESVFQTLVLQVGMHALHLPAAQLARHATGSGDTLFNYVQALIILALALVSAAAWTMVDRSRSHPRLREWLRIAIRYCLALALLAYGFAKIVPTQFPFPRLDTLVRPYGHSSPMRLLWTFMGYSMPYNVFTGLVEAGAGALLFGRRTTTAGALLATAAMANVVVLNFAYDVPVKLYSTHLLLMAVFLLAPDARRLIDVFVRNRATEPAPMPPLFESPRLRRAAVVVKTLFVVGVAIQCATLPAMTYRRFVLAPKPPLYGLWNVGDFSRDGVAVPIFTGDGRWRRVIFTANDTLLIYTSGEEFATYRVTRRAAAGTLEVATLAGDVKSELKYTQSAEDRLVLRGAIDGGVIEAQLRRVPEDSFLLVNRGFHWIQEYPFNR